MDTKLLLTALISGVVAATLTWFLAGSGTQAPNSLEASFENRRDAATESLEPLLQAVAEGLDDLRQELRATRDAASSSQPIATEPYAGDAAHGEALARIEALCEQLLARPAAGAGLMADLRDPALLPSATQRASAIASLVEVDLTFEELGRRHLLWSNRELLKRYGVPDRMWVWEGVVNWAYTYGKDGEEHEFSFSVFDGRVVGVSN